MNKYKTWYDSIIARARNRVTDDYTELHHILPRSLGGDDSPDNLAQDINTFDQRYPLAKTLVLDRIKLQGADGHAYNRFMKIGIR